MYILLQQWTGPYGGVPPFDKVKISDFQPAIEEGMNLAWQEIEAITASTEPPMFANTIEPYDAVGQALDRALTIYRVWADTMSSDEVRDVEKEVQPKLAAFYDRILQNEALFNRIATVYKSDLTPQQRRLTWDHYTEFVRAGANLTTEQKERVAAINQQLATLYTQFSNNILHDEENYALHLKEDQLDGLPESLKQGDRAILNTRSSVDPFLTYSAHRDLREKVWRTFYSRGDNNDEYDNKQIIRQILKLRAERTKLQGYATFADRALEKEVAKTPQAAMELMRKVWPAAIARVRQEVADMEAIAGHKIEPWDYLYYADKVRKAKYDLDANEVKQYLQLDALREGMMWVAGELYGFSFKPVSDLPVYHPDVRVWQVTRNGEHVGLWYFDPYARPGKRSGAWMNAYRPQKKFGGDQKTIVSNNSNFVRGDSISWDDARTLFHEFGHAIHGLCSDVTYQSQSGTNVPRDYVEFPSQIHERWLPTQEVLSRFAPIPPALVEKIERAAKSNQGFATTEYLSSALFDMKIHSLANVDDLDPTAFERDTLAELGMPEELAMRHRPPQFAHVFSSEGYAARYYSYMWADALTADAWEAFLDGEGPFDKKIAKSLFDNVLSKGNTIDPADGYRNFRGRDVDTDALMRDRFGV